MSSFLYWKILWCIVNLRLSFLLRRNIFCIIVFLNLFCVTCQETHRNTTSEVKNETVRWNATPNNQQQKGNNIKCALSDCLNITFILSEGVFFLVLIWLTGTPVHPGDVQSLPSTNVCMDLVVSWILCLHVVFAFRASNISILLSQHTTDSTVKSIEYRKGDVDESRKLCEQKFGSYCLWREENKEKMKDLMVKKLKDLLFVARSYYPTIAKIPTESKFTHEMKVNIQDFERVLSESTTDLDLPPQ